jgi:hypothetical protein
MMPEGSTAGSPGPLPAEDREKVRAYVAACLGRGEMVAATAHTRLFAQTGVRLSYPSFSRYWRDAVEAGGAVETPRPSLLDIARGDATGEGEDEVKVIQSAAEAGHLPHQLRDRARRQARPARLHRGEPRRGLVLRGFGGTKTFREFMRLFDGVRLPLRRHRDARPNEYIELLAYAAFLDVMDVGRRRPASSSATARRPTSSPSTRTRSASSGCGSRAGRCSSRSRPISASPTRATSCRRSTCAGTRCRRSRRPAPSATGRGACSARPRRSACRGGAGEARQPAARIAKLMELRAEDPAAHRVLWHDLEAERHAIEAAIPASVGGLRQPGPRRARAGDHRLLRGRSPSWRQAGDAGSGCNFQRHCAWAIFLGIGFKFNDFIQAVHRCTASCSRGRCASTSSTPRPSASPRSLEEKWAPARGAGRAHAAIIREYGLALGRDGASAGALDRRERVEVAGEGFAWSTTIASKRPRAWSRQRRPDRHLDPVLDQYEYTPSYNDFGHTDDNEHFWAQMDFLTPSCCAC